LRATNSLNNNNNNNKSHRAYISLSSLNDVAPDQRICCIFIAQYVVRPVLEYACPVWHPSLTAGQVKKIESLQQRAMKIIFPDKDYSLALVFASVDWLESRRDYLSERFFRRCVLRESSCLRTLPASGQTALGHYRQATTCKSFQASDD